MTKAELVEEVARAAELTKKDSEVIVDEVFKNISGGKMLIDLPGIVLIDEIHTPDSSRYFYSEGYQDRQDKGEEQKQLSKEFVRKWLIENNFQGKDGQVVPVMTQDIVNSISERYIELYEQITGDKFVKNEQSDVLDRIERNINTGINSLLS